MCCDPETVKMRLALCVRSDLILSLSLSAGIQLFRVSTTITSPRSDLVRSAQRFQVLTIFWMAGEAAVALAAAWKARSPALLGFGGDSAIELLSAMVVFWRFRARSSRAERIAAKVAGVLLFVVAILVVVGSILSFAGYAESHPSYIGIVLLVVAAIGMPWLASKKRQLAVQLGSAALKADAAESSLCGYLSWIALGGLLANAIFGKSWADPAAALLLVPLVLKEAWEATHSSETGSHCC